MTQITTRDGRYYTWNGDKYPSVTTILGKGIPKPGLIKWAGRFVAEGAVKQLDQWVDLTEEEAIAWLSGLPDRRRNSSANLGSVIHAAIDSVANGREMKPVSEQAQGYVDSFNQFVIDFKPKFLLTEAAVFNRTHRYAGTLDIVCRIGRTNWVVDTKTGNRVYPETALQLSAYANAEFVGREGADSEEPMPKVKKGAILHLSGSGYSFIPARIDEEVFETFLSVKDVWRYDFELSKLVLREPMEVPSR